MDSPSSARAPRIRQPDGDRLLRATGAVLARAHVIDLFGGEDGHGIAHLQRTQDESGQWRQDAYTGGGFPRVFYLRYYGYPAFFPLWALARYRNLRRGNVRRVVHGM